MPEAQMVALLAHKFGVESEATARSQMSTNLGKLFEGMDKNFGRFHHEISAGS